MNSAPSRKPRRTLSRILHRLAIIAIEAAAGRYYRLFDDRPSYSGWVA